MSALLDTLRTRWQQLERRERTTLSIGAVAAALIVVAGGLWTLGSRVEAARERLERKQRDLVFVQLASAEILAAGPLRSGITTQEPLLVVADRLARESGLRETLASTESGTDGSLRATFRGASFDMLAGMLFRLTQQHGITIREARIEGSSEPGRVDATFLLAGAPATAAAR